MGDALTGLHLEGKLQGVPLMRLSGGLSLRKVHVGKLFVWG